MNATPETLCIGLMSGTSLDGIDGVLARFDGAGRPQVLAHAHTPYTQDLRQRFEQLQAPGPNELHRMALAGNALSLACAQLCQQLLAPTGHTAAQVRVIGVHGQTVRHQPGLHDGLGYTWQVLQPAVLAEHTGIDVVADLRSRDVAAGGQGAPLVPAFHHGVFGDAQRHVAVLNLGGIANLSLLPAHGPVRGWDCGPANTLLDAWCQHHTGAAFDQGGHWAASGQVHADLLTRLLSEPFFAHPPPKSTGRDLFHLDWLQAQLAREAPVPAVDVQATLLALTVESCARDLQRHGPNTQRLVVCGGGALNTTLMARLRQRLNPIEVVSSDALGLPAQQVEATAFAWLAWCHVMERPGNLPAVTGAQGPRVLGALYPR